MDSQRLSQRGRPSQIPSPGMHNGCNPDPGRGSSPFQENNDKQTQAAAVEPYPYPSPEQAAARMTRENYPAGFPAPSNYETETDNGKPQVYIPDFSEYSLTKRIKQGGASKEPKKKRPCPPPSLFPYGQQVYPGLYVSGISAMLHQEFLQLADITHILVIGPNISNPYPETTHLKFMSIPTIVHAFSEETCTPCLRVPSAAMPQIPLFYDSVLRKKRIRERANMIRKRTGAPLLPDIDDNGEEIPNGSVGSQRVKSPQFESLNRTHLEKAFKFIHEARLGDGIWKHENRVKFGVEKQAEANLQEEDIATKREREKISKLREAQREEKRSEIIAALRMQAKLDPEKSLPVNAAAANPKTHISKTSFAAPNMPFPDLGYSQSSDSVSVKRENDEKTGKKDNLQDEPLKKCGNVLVVSYDGNARASAIACAYLMRIMSIAPQTAFGYIKSARGTAELTKEYQNLLEGLYKSGTWEVNTPHDAHIQALPKENTNCMDESSSKDAFRNLRRRKEIASGSSPKPVLKAKAKSGLSKFLPKSQHVDLWKMICCGNSVDRAAAGAMMSQSFASSLAFGAIVSLIFMTIIVFWKGSDLWAFSERFAQHFEDRFATQFRHELTNIQQTRIQQQSSRDYAELLEKVADVANLNDN